MAEMGETMTTLEQRCRRLVKKWQEPHAGRHFEIAWIMEGCARELLAILPKRKAKKRREEIRYGGTPPALRRKAKKGAKR
jgi:hypothetical protein